MFQINFGNGFETVATPANSAEAVTELIWTSQTPSAEIKSANFEWLGDVAQRIYDAAFSGINGGYGIYEGLPLRIVDCNVNDSLNYLLDLANSATLLECDKVSCPIIDKGRKDWFDLEAASFTFSYLASPESLNTAAQGFSILTTSDYKRTPYCISEIPDYTTVATLSTNLFLIGYETEQKVEDLIRHTSKFAGDVQTAVTIIGIEEVIRVILDAVQIILDVIVIYKLIQLFIDVLNDIIDAIIQEKKFKFCMREQDLFRKGCQYLGLNFDSTIYAIGSEFENATYMPHKVVQPKIGFSGTQTHVGVTYQRPANEADVPANCFGYYEGTFKEFIDEMCEKYNAAVVVKNNTVYFQDKHSYNVVGDYKLPNTGEVGYTFNLPKPSGTNASELPFNYALQFALDESELNTLSKYEGTTCQYQIRPNAIGDIKNQLKTGGKVVEIKCALGKRKDYYTRPENFLLRSEDEINNMINVIVPAATTLKDTIIGTTLGAAGALAGAIFDLYGNPTYDVPQINIAERLGWLLLSDDAFSVPKTFIGKQVGDEWHVANDSSQVMNASNLMDKLHKYNLATHGNQWLTFKNHKIPFCCSDLEKVKDCNVFDVPENKTAKFTRVAHNHETDTAECDYMVNENFTNNLTETIWIDGKQV